MTARAEREAGEGWCELHCHSGFSLLDGASMPEALAARAAALGYPALALTDHDSLAGIVAHATACTGAGIRPIAGCELTLDDGPHLTLLARDAEGYRSLASLLSAAHLAGTKGFPRAGLADVAAHAAGVECLTGCRQGAVPAALARGDDAGARAALDDLQEIFGAGHLWVEVQRPGLPGDARLSHALADLARRRGLPLAATGDAHYAHRADRDLQDVLVCVRERVPLPRARPHLRQGASWHLRPPAAMARRFADLPAALAGTRMLADRCGFDLGHIDAAFPAFPVPDEQGADGYLRRLVLAGAAERYGEAATSAAVADRIEHELATIAHLGMADYLLVVWDLVREARARGILCQGRGSAVGSLVCYCLGITAVEPLAHRLSFERFLSVGRTDPPDVDLDLPADRDGHDPAREAIIHYALTRYAGHAALACNVVTFRARSALRGVGTAFGLDAAQMARIAPRVKGALAAVAPVPEPEQRQGAGSPGGQGADPAADHAAGSALPRRIADLCRRLEGLPRHLSQHPGGVVLSRRPLCEVVPIEHARMAGRTVIQWDKDGIEAAGLPKIDLLGLGMLGAIDRAFALIGQQTGVRPALHGFRCDDRAVYELLCRMDTVGVFQVESRAQMAACLPHLQPRCYEDLIVSVALIRPGPIQGGAVHPYLRRRRGEEPVRYPGGAAGARLLGPILGETLGVCLYQDQVIEIARAAGLDPSEAAALRRAMSGARDAGRMAALGARLRAGLASRGLDEAGRDEVATMVQAFSGYGFVKGHAAAFAYLAYVSAWLKVYHPAAFYGALLDLQPMGFYPPEVLVQDAARRGVRVLPVDAHHSGVDCTPEGEALRLGLRLVRGLGADAAGRVVAAMAGDEPPATVEALCRAARLDEGQARALARSGALRGLRDPRRQALWEAPVAARAGREGWLPDLAAAAEGPVALPPATESDELALDRAAVGFTPGAHALAPLRPLLPAGLARSADLPALPAGTVVEVAGQAISWQRPPTARGMLFLSLTDEDGLLNVVVPPRVRERDGEAALREPLLLVRGVLERQGRSLSIRALALRPLASILTDAPR